MFKNYLDELSKLVFRPILFYSRLPEGEWHDKPVTFLGITGFIVSIVSAFIVFVTISLPIGATLFEKVQPSKYLIIAPVMFVLACAFSIMTLILVFGVVLAILFGLFWFIAVLLYPASNIFGERGNFIKDIKSLFYSSGTVLVFCLPILMVFLTKNRAMDFTNFVIGYNMLYSFWVLYLYGVMAIIARKEHNLPKWKAFAAAVLPVLFLILIGIIVNKAILPKIQPWIM